MKHFWKITILLFLLSGNAISQNRPATTNPTPSNNSDDYVWGSLRLKAKGYDDKIVLRWAFDNTAIWPFLQYSGVWIEAVTLNKNNKPTTPGWVRLNKEPLKPWSKDQMKSVVKTADDNLLIVGQALYGSTEVSPKNDRDIEGITDANMAYQSIVTLALVASDFSTQAADAMGVRFEYPIKINKDFKYAFRVFPAQNHPVFRVDTGFFMYSGKLKDEISSPEFVRARGKDGIIEVYWPRNSPFNRFTSYNIERSRDGKSFTRLNKKPIVYNLADTTQKDFVFIDSVANYTTWYYRVNGKDAFGDESYWCPTVSAMASNQNAPPSAFLYAKLSGKDEVYLKWEQLKDKNRPLKGFIIRRGKDRQILDEAIHQNILPPSTNTYKDKPKDLSKGVYYQVIAIDTAGNYSTSNTPYVFTYDTIPPLPPTGFKGTIDSLGVVHLSWDYDFNDNVYAYRLFAANNPTHTFSPVNSALIEDVQFVDSLSNTLSNRKIYYKLIALDGSNNHSKPTEILTLNRPKLETSPAPVIGLFTIGDKKVSFDYSYFADDEITSALIFRRQVGENNWRQIASQPPYNTNFTDTTVTTGARYQYMVRTKDVFEMLSKESFPLQVSVYHVSQKAPVIQVNTLSEQNSAAINWVLPREKVKYFIVYKDTGEGFIQYKSLPATATNFSEPLTGKLRYGIRPIYENTDIDSPIFEGKWVEMSGNS